MKKIRKMTYILVGILLFSFSAVSASEVEVSEDGRKVLTLEEAIDRAKMRDKQLKLQDKNIDFTKADLDDADDQYQNAMEFSYDMANANYDLKYANKLYAEKLKPVLEEKVVYDIETQFDTILDLEERYAFAQDKLVLENKNIRQNVRKQQLGVESESSVKTEKVSLDTHLLEIKDLEQSIEAGYRKLNDTIGGKQQKYTLIKENIYRPVDEKRSLKGYISYAIDTDPNLWILEESAKAQKGTIWANTATGAPTYAEFEKRKIGYEQGVTQAAVGKENQELRLKDMYEDILNLEIQYDKVFPNLEEAKRQYENLQVRYRLGLVPQINVEQAELGVRQTETQINSLIRQHNQLKALFEKPYLLSVG